MNFNELPQNVRDEVERVLFTPGQWTTLSSFMKSLTDEAQGKAIDFDNDDELKALIRKVRPDLLEGR